MTPPRPARPRRRPLAVLLAVLVGGVLATGSLVAGTAPADANADADASADAVQTITIDPASGGRTFEGVGAISGGGGTSRLLVDYPEPQRSQVLDYMFSPDHGAALDILKVEIGGDTHSSNGAEPSHERVRGQIDCNRGYEWWLMEQAKKRNPDVKLYGLAWGAPGWFDGGYWSQDSIDYLVDWLDCAKQHHLKIDYLGGRNEREPDLAWFVDLKKTLVARGYGAVKVVASDTAGLGIVQDLKEDAAFRDAVDVVGLHYPCSALRCTPNQDLMDSGKPLWASESGWNNYLTGATRLGSEINHQYVDSRMTAFINWPAIYSWYPTVQYQNSGLMKANEPWSGSFDVGPSLWTVAQTSQFTDPGWKYVDSASKYLDGQGTVATQRDPKTGDWSAVVETTAATEPQTLRFAIGDGLKAPSTVQQWSTVLESQDSADWFAHDAAADPVVHDGVFEATVQPGRVYTFSTITTAHKSEVSSPASKPMDYFSQSFNGFPNGVSPTWFSDMEGAFETAKCPTAPTAAGVSRAPQGKCLAQVISEKPEVWMRTPYPVSLVGDITWSDYDVATDVLLQDSKQVGIAGRIVNEYNSTKLPRTNTWMGYYVWLGRDGAWRLEVNLPQDSVNKGATVVLASGKVDGFDPSVWHRAGISFDGDAITPTLDGADLATVHDKTYRAGQTGLTVDSWTRAAFDDYAATPHA